MPCLHFALYNRGKGRIGQPGASTRLHRHPSMKKLFSTEDVHPRDRFDYWHSVVCKNLVEHASNPVCRQTFEANIETGMLADISLFLFENSPMDAIRSAQHVARAGDDELFLCRQISGTLALEQDGRQASLEAGGFALLDPRLP